MSTTQFADFSTSPQLDIVESKQERKARGVKAAYVDTYNQAEMAKYNNEYNYWLWQQQAEYNDPINQVARLKAAGLNPNYNAIEGTGNLTSRPESQGKITSNPVANTVSLINAGIGGFNALLKGISEGIDSYSKISSTPKLGDIKGYRDALAQSMRATGKYNEKRADFQEIETLFNGLISGYDYTDPTASSVTGGARFEKLGKSLTIQDKQAALLEMKATIGKVDKALKKAQTDRIETLTDIQAESLKADIENTRVGTALRLKELNLKDFKTFVGPILSVFKMFLPFK